MKHLTLALTLLFAFDLASANETYRAGIIESIEENRIVFETEPVVLEYKPGSFSYVPVNRSDINFSCEIEVCKLLTEFQIGDEVLTKFDVIDGKDKLLDIRLCIQNEAECQLVLDEDESEKNKIRDSFRQALIASKIAKQCRARMNEELAADDRFAKEDWFNTPLSRDVIYNEARQISNDPESLECLETIYIEQVSVFLDVCEKHGCPDRVAGGCAHLAGNRSFLAARMHAVEQCR